MPDFLRDAEELFDYTRELRRDFHRHPELGFEEFRTSRIVAKELNEIGLEVSTGIAETGVVAILEGRKKTPVILLRFDMDALPILEKTGVEYASENEGLMHACGHDGHVAVGLTVARLLHRHRGSLEGLVKLVFQPAEEGQGGAKRMVEEGVLENPRPDYSLAMHLWNDKPIGWLGISPGPIMAAADKFRLLITGKGGHGASPHQTKDPILAAAQVITSVQSIVSRNIDPLKAAVISITSLHGGDAFNVIPSSVELKGTIRSFDPKVRDLAIERFREIVMGVGDAFNCRAEIDITEVTPAVINHRGVTESVQNVAIDLFPGSDLEVNQQTMGSEDMAYMMQDVPGCYIFVGSANPAKGLDAKHHHPKFNFDEEVLPKAVALMAAACNELIGTI